MVPEGWDLVEAQDICHRISVGIVVKPKDYYVPEGEGIRAFRSANVREGFVEDSNWTYISKEGHQKNKKSILQAGDVLVVRTGYPGTACVVPDKYAGANCIDIIFARPDAERVLPEYLCDFTNSEYGKKQVLDGQGGLAQQHFNVGSYNKLRVPLPPLPEQRKIADILATWDVAIEKTEALLATARTQKRALMQQLLTGRRRFPEFEGQPWKEVRLGQIAEITSGPAFKSDEFMDEGYKLVRGSNVKRGYLDWSPSITVHWPSDNGLEDYRLAAGDIVIAMDGYVGRSHAYLAKEPEDPLLLVQRVARVRSKDSDPSFLYANICSHDFFAHCERMKTATGIAHITMKDIRDFKVPGITRTEQNAIGQVFEGCDGEVSDLVAQLQKLRTEKKALMQQLLTGKRRVKVEEHHGV